MDNSDSFFREAVVRLCGNLDTGQAMNNCLAYLAEHIPVDAILLTLIRQELQSHQVVHSVSALKSPKVGTLLPFPQCDHRIYHGDWSDPDSLWLINRPAEDPALQQFLQESRLPYECSLMILHLNLNKEGAGKLIVKTEGNDRYNLDHAQLLSLLRVPFTIALSNSLRHQEVKALKELLSDDCQYYQKELRKVSDTEIIGADTGLKIVTDKLHQVAALDSTVLLLGETGVGKEVIASAIHSSSSRRNGPFIKVNCGAIPENLIDSELFGYEKGAFTGADTKKRGRFERADRGTIFLDEIGELPAQAQVRLLHVLQNRSFERVGGNEVIPVDIRVILATHRNLEEMIEDGLFRKDLYFRMNVFPIMIPPLRDRIEDIPALTHHFLNLKAQQLKIRTIPPLRPDALYDLQHYHWPGNIRELENVIERALIQYKSGYLDFKSFLTALDRSSISIAQEAGSQDFFLSLEETIRRQIISALKLAKGKISGSGGAAELLQIHPNTLRKKMDKLQIPYRRTRVLDTHSMSTRD